MLTIDRATYDAIVAHAKRDHPDEACGIVAGPEGSDRPERLVEMVNAAGSRQGGNKAESGHKTEGGNKVDSGNKMDSGAGRQSSGSGNKSR